MDIAAIILVRGKKPPIETINLAKEFKIPLLTTKYILFQTAGRLYTKGIVRCREQVEDHSANS
jgi:serine kinase of HPr protein (carbohydrate metabolism regulator)